MRIPYVDPKTVKNENTRNIIEKIQQRRAPNPLLELDLALLHAPELANGWNEFFGAIRQRGRLTRALKEVAICRVAVLNGALYEWEQHYPLAVRAGVSQAIMTLVLRGTQDDWNEFGVGTDDEDEECIKAVIDYTDAMTRQIKVSDKVFGEVQLHLSNQEVVELTATIAGYNAVSRFLVALDVGERNDAAMAWTNLT
jgi:alkylhydroperoxidase family enzyme